MGTQVAVMGVGPMGAPIAQNLAAAGRSPVVWNRSPGPLDVLRDSGLSVASSPEDIAAPTVLVVLPDIDQFRAVTGNGVWGRWAAAGVERVVVMSTTSPEKVRVLGEDLDRHGISVADAPMSGGVSGARRGRLSVMVGALDADWPVIEETLRPAAATIVHFGPPGAGSVAKLCNQVVVAGTLAAISEALALAERAGLDRAALLDVFAGGLASSAVLHGKRDRLLARDYVPSGSAANQLKDLRYASALARSLDATAPLTEILLSLFQTVVDSGRGDEDHAVVLEQFRRDLPD